MSETKKHSGQLVFGLDIGTRSIVGTVGYLEDETFHIIAQRVKEHESRAMLDGQIHDIAAVGATIKQVKEGLEETLGRPLKEVCIAAAGRVLRTVNVSVTQEFEDEVTVDQEMVYSLDLLGVEKAYEKMAEINDTEMKFYCVGYTVVKYYLNGYPMSNLENHKARNIGADIIATFLPDDVVDGLYKAVQLADLQVANLTLEPIAAIQVAIPQMYRMLNIALVDVGAGTSDISITKDGSIIAYGMIPSAGDELTETIAKSLLVDFAQAEKIKIACAKKTGTITYKDIMGLPQKITPAGVHKIVQPVINAMAKEIADGMKNLNGGKPVSAVFVVGGGGKIAGFTGALAKELGIQSERVALRGEEVMGNIEFDCQGGKKDSLFVTPIGICLNFYDQKNNFIFVSFNGERIKLYDNSHLLVVDAAMQAGYPNENLFPRRGPELHYTINGKQRVMRGNPGETAVITVNGEAADINTPIAAGDKIIVKESTIGDSAVISVGQLPEYDSSISVVVNDKTIVLPKFAQVNGQLQSAYYDIQDGDDIKMLSYYTVQQIVEFMDVILKDGMNIYVNNKRVDTDAKVYENFSVIWTMEELNLSDYDHDSALEAEKFENLPDGDEGDIEKARLPEEMKGMVSKAGPQVKWITGPGGQLIPVAVSNGEQEESVKAPEPEYPVVHVSVNGTPVELTGKENYIFVDIFAKYDFDMKNPQGAMVATIRNGHKADYTEELVEGDSLLIKWVNSFDEIDQIAAEAAANIYVDPAPSTEETE